MELFTVGYQGRTLPQFVKLLREQDITLLVDVRERPVSRKRGFSALPLSEALRKVGIGYESDRQLGNPTTSGSSGRTAVSTRGERSTGSCSGTAARHGSLRSSTSRRINASASSASKPILICATARSSRRKQFALNRTWRSTSCSSTRRPEDTQNQEPVWMSASGTSQPAPPEPP